VDLLQKRREPLTPIFIVVPSKKTASFLLQKIAENSPFHTAFGMEIFTLDEALHKFACHLFREDLYVPDELDFEIEALLYLKKEKPEMSKKEQQEFAKRFKTTLKRWFLEGKKEETQTPYFRQADEIWQQLQREKSNWLFFHEALERKNEETEEPKKTLQKGLIFLFGFSFMSASFHAFFSRLANIHTIFAYILSPCMMYWEDIVSDREALQLKHQKISQEVLEKLDVYLADRHPLLANFGKKGREYSALLEEVSPHRKALYRVAGAIKEHPFYQDLLAEHSLLFEETGSKPTLLECLQADLLLLRGKRKEKIEVDCGSVSFHFAPTKLREVEVLYENIRKKLAASTIFSLRPAQILILAPNIEVYLPYIQRVFGLHELPFQVLTQTETQKHGGASLKEAFFHLLALKKSRFSNEALRQLFDCTHFVEKLKIAEEERGAVDHFFRASSFRWGKDGQQRADLLKEEGYLVENSFNEKGTWKEERARFIKNLQDGLHIEDEVGSRLVFCLDALFSHFEKLRGEHPLSFYSEEFHALLTFFFAREQSADESTEEKLLELAFTLFARKAKLCTGLFTLEEAVHIFTEIYAQQEENGRASFLFMPCVCASLEDMVPASVDHLFLLGCDEDQFPRWQKGKEQCERDNYLFIEALITARKTLTISLESYSFKDDAKKEPASSLKALMKEIEDHFQLSYPLHVTHPLFCPQVRATPQEKVVGKSACQEESVRLEKDEEIDMKELLSAFRSPLKSYYEKEHGLFLSQFKEKKDKFLSLERYDLTRLYAASLWQGRDEFRQSVLKERKLPENSFQAPYVYHTEKMQEELQEMAKKIGVREVGTKKCEPMLIEFTPAAKKVEWITEKRLLLPELEYIHQNKRIVLRGTLSSVYPQVPLFFERYSLKACVCALPALFLRSLVGKMEEIREMGYFQGEKALDVHFLRDKKSVRFNFEHADLKDYLLYTLLCRQYPICLYPQFAEDFFNGERDKIGEALEKNREEEEDPYLAYYLEQHGLDDLFSRFEQHQSLAKKLFVPLFSSEATTG
jgi:exodeoxyribonuclease V gamma subunit